MNPLADLPPWIAVLVALFAGGVLVALNLGWLMAAKSMLDAQRNKSQERRAGAPAAPPSAPSTPAPEARDDRRTEGSGPTDRTPIV